MKNNLILASSDKTSRLLLLQQKLIFFEIATLLAPRFDAHVHDEVMRIKPEILLLDFDLVELNNFYDVTTLRKLCTETSIIILSDEMSEGMEWELLKAGVRGCCLNDSTAEILNQVVTDVQQGQLWIRRKLISRLIDELGKTTAKNKAYRASLGLLNKLTQREYDIAMCVGNGQSNKQIAQACAITERTVKAHLTEIFLKLGVTDRLNLALVLSADERGGL